MSDKYDIRAVILQVIQDKHPKVPTDVKLHQGSVLEEIKRKLRINYEYNEIKDNLAKHSIKTLKDNAQPL